MQFIEEYVNTLVDDNKQGFEIAERLGVSVSMVSSYKKGEYNPSITVAMYVYKNEGIVFHPFSEESLKFEIKKDSK